MRNLYLERPVFICGHRKGGTTLLINLFDGAKDALVYPDDSGLFYLYYPRYDDPGVTLEEKKKRLIEVIIGENLKGVIAKVNATERPRLENKRKYFARLIDNYEKENVSTRDVLLYFIESFQKAFFSDADELLVWIEKTTSTEIYALELSEMFSQAKFIHIIRDPRDNWASLRSGWEKRYKYFNDNLNRLKHSMLERGKLGMEFAVNNQATIGKQRYRVVKYEDLVMSPKDVMMDLAEFVGIQFTNNLLKATTLGFPWRGNNFERTIGDKPSTSSVGKWKQRLNDEDVSLVEYWFKDLMDLFGYNREKDLWETQKAVINHYKWYNFSTPWSAK